MVKFSPGKWVSICHDRVPAACEGSSAKVGVGETG